MKRFLLLLPPLSLLVACSDLLGVKLPSLGPDDVPNVARATRLSAPDCSRPGLIDQASGGSMAHLRYANLAPATGLKTQASASTLLGLLSETRRVINTNYYGFSTTDLQALHKTYETKFRSTFGNLNRAIPTGIDTLMNQYVDSLDDKHSYYLNPEQYREYNDATSGALTPEPGFGFSGSAVPGESGVVLTDVDGNGPSSEVLSRGDVIVAVNGEALGSDFQASSSVLARAAKSERPVIFNLRRDEALLTKTITSGTFYNSNSPTLRFKAGTAVLRLPSFFTPNAAQKVHSLIKSAQEKGASGLILDLRNNKGGFLEEAAGITAAFAPKQAGQTMETLDAHDITFTYEGDDSRGNVVRNTVCRKEPSNVLPIRDTALWTGKLAVIVNAKSASASEVVASILRKTGVPIVGETTDGVGNTSINLFALPGNRALAVTVARSRGLDGAYLPDKVIPDIRVADDLKQLAHGRDLPLEAALSKVR